MESKALFTKYAESLDKSCPHAYYPRPQLVRDSYLCLNGEWRYGTSHEREAVRLDRKITVPFPPEAPLSGIGEHATPDEYMHYSRRVTLPEGFVKDRVLLHLGAIDQEAWVYVNGKYIGERLGGYIPFEFDITDYIGSREFELRVTVRDAYDKKYPYGKQTEQRGGMWYTPVGGIWQTVWLESVPEDYIKAMRFTPIDGGVHLEIVGGRAEKTIEIEGLGVYKLSGGEMDIVPEEPRLWTPEEPNLYIITVSTENDSVRSYFAIRWIDVREVGGVQRICLNSEPYVFNGLLDQGYYPDGLFLPATEEGYLDDIRLARSLGYNMLRKHIKIEPDIFYYYCDREGIAVFQDMVNNSDYSFLRDTALPTVGLQRLSDKNAHKNPESRRIFEKTMLETIELLYNHPSVVYYTVFNEGWGQFRADEMYEIAKRADPTRIVDATSGWFRQTESDVDSRHIYFKPLKVKGLSGKPLVISEFGGYSYRVEGHLFGKDNYGYRLFKSREELEDALIALYDNEVKPLVDAGASAFVYTQVSDVEDETNGLVTYDRKVVKVDAERVSRAIGACSGKA